MKVFITSDLEGTCGIASWLETNLGEYGSDYICKQMTREVGTVATAALNAGAEEVFVRDSHETAKNIFPDGLPRGTKLMRGWTGDVYDMMSGIDSAKFDAAMMTGFHAPARSNGSPLAHTVHRYIESVKINGELGSEFMINAYTAGYFGVPVCFISGDKAICDMAKELIPAIRTAPVVEGIGNATVSMHPDDAIAMIKRESEIALADGYYKKCIVNMPEAFEIEVSYKDHHLAYKNSFYPGAVQMSGNKIRYKSTNYMDVLRFVAFCVN